MCDGTSEVLGAYGDIVVGLQAKLQQAKKKQRLSLSVIVVGHGGRDSLGALAVVDAIASDPNLRGHVQVHICTCSWADDDWEVVLERYVDHIENKGVISKGTVQVHSMKFHREHKVIREKLDKHLKGKSLVVQCEQGVDFFVNPLSSPWLQDNYEDHWVHDVCMKNAQKAGIPVLLLQTNSDLDLSRGAGESDINTNVFQGRLQTNAFGQKIVFQKGFQAEKIPDSVINLAVAIGLAPDKKEAFKEYLNFDLDDAMLGGAQESCQKQPCVQNLYSDFISFGAATMKAAQLPVAGVLEVIASLQQQGHEMPWQYQQVGMEVPQPQWLLSRLLQPNEVANGNLRVLTEFREARLHEAQSLVDYLYLWMLGRRGRRDHGEGRDIEGRFSKNFRGQLLLARQLAQDVKACYPDFDIWRADSAILRSALAGANSALASSEGSRLACENKTRIAKSREPDFEFVPISLFTSGTHIMLLDFTCRMLESESGVNAEFKAIWDTLPRQGKNEDDTSDLKSMGAITHSLAEVFKEELIKAWQKPSP